jgi:plastocyanin
LTAPAPAPERGILPIALPITLLGLIASAAFLFSRVLLNVHKDIAVAVALSTAFSLLAFFSFMSSRIGKANPIEKVMALGALLLPMALGAAVALKIIPTKAEGGKAEAGPVAVNLTAKNLKFDKGEIRLTANIENTVNLNNQDTQPHNVIVFGGADVSAPRLNDGQPIANAGQKVAYKVKAPGPGTYYFHCDIHPTMSGKAVVKEGPAGGKEAAGGGTVALSAKGLKFDKSEITVPANTEATINLDNKDTQPHNVVVFNGADATAPKLNDGQPIASPNQKVKYTFKSPGPGTYFFHCEIHPAQMTGKIAVK